MERTCGRDCFKRGRGHLSALSRLFGTVLEQHRVLVRSKMLAVQHFYAWTEYNTSKLSLAL